MEGLVIRSHSKQNLKLLTELAKKLGEEVTPLKPSQLEDFNLGTMMQKAKTGKNVSRNTIMKKLTGR